MSSFHAAFLLVNTWNESTAAVNDQSYNTCITSASQPLPDMSSVMLQQYQITCGMVQLLNSKMQQQQIEWRRAKVLELSSQGYSQIEIASNLQIDKSVISRDMAYLRNQAQAILRVHIQDKLPEEYQNCMVGINQVLKICWDIVNKSRNLNNNDNNGQTVTMTDNKTVLQALALINDCNKYKMDLTTNGVIITDAIKFVQNK
jgi:hypothetical protein